MRVAKRRRLGVALRHSHRGSLRKIRMCAEGGVEMVTVGLLVRLAAKPGRELELEQFLRSALPLVENEPGTPAWFALKFGPLSFGIFDAFPDETSRQEHLAGAVAAALMARAGDLLSAPPEIEYVDTFASKLPHAADALRPTGVLGPEGANDE
jgi:quinol monooxygenase YgiN